MHFYGPVQSPFASRVRIACRIKGLALADAMVPEGGLKSPDFLAMNPIGKVPVWMESDIPIIESETILDFVEDNFPDVALRPASPLDRAHMRTIIRVTDTYVMVPVSRLFAHVDPLYRDERIVGEEVARWREGLGWLSGYVADAPFAFGDRLTLADCVLPPSLLLCDLISGMLDLGDLVAEHAPLAGYRKQVLVNEPVRIEIDRTRAALGMAPK
jgi:glutathione S-transferase